MSGNGVKVDHIHLLDHQIAFGVQPDMTGHGWDRDDFPKLWQTIRDADILTLLRLAFGAAYPPINRFRLSLNLA